MKQRLISALGGLVVLFAVLFFFDTVVLNIAVSVIAVLAVYEVLQATGYLKNRIPGLVSMAFAALIPLFKLRFFLWALPTFCYAFVLVLFISLLRNHKTIRVEQVGFVFFVCIAVPFSLTTIVYMRDGQGAMVGLFYTLLTLASAWMADTGAYFAGLWFGKHKLAPEISPKKTVEGAVGGVLVAMVSVVLIAYLYALLCPLLFGARLQVNYGLIALLSPLLTAASIVGDLSASIIKRQCGVKDFGQIMPGHGGVMDRFDSVLFVAPAVFILSRLLPLAGLY